MGEEEEDEYGWASEREPSPKEEGNEGPESCGLEEGCEACGS